MTPDRTDHTTDDGAENGILIEAGSLDITSIGILGDATAKIDLNLAAPADEDDFDDSDVVDEVIPSGTYVGLDGTYIDETDEDSGKVAVGDAAAENVADAVETVEPEAVTAADAAVDIAADNADEAVAEAELVDDIAEGYDEPADADADADADAVELESAHIELADEPSVEESAAEEPAAEEPVADEPAAQIAAVEEPVAEALSAEVEAVVVAEAPVKEVVPVVAREEVAPVLAPQASVVPPVSTPKADTGVTRTALARAERMRASERIDHPREPEVELTSRRVGEIENRRETADLLTADRLIDPQHVVKAEPEGGWQRFVYSISGHRINLGDSTRVREHKALSKRIATQVPGGAKFVPVISRKGGVGKTTLTTLIGMALADARDDRIIAVDANPDRGTLAERIARTSGHTVRDLVREVDHIRGYNDVSKIVARDETRLDVLASETDPHVSEAFSDRDYLDVAALAEHYYSFVLTDTGTGIVHSVMGATLARADEIVIVTGLSVDEARLASETLTWLETNGYADLARSAVVVLNNARPGAPIVRADELESHFKSRVRQVLRVPYDPHIAAGSAITFKDLHSETQKAAREIAAAVVEGFRDKTPSA